MWGSSSACWELMRHVDRSVTGAMGRAKTPRLTSGPCPRFQWCVWRCVERGPLCLRQHFSTLYFRVPSVYTVLVFFTHAQTRVYGVSACLDMSVY